VLFKRARSALDRFSPLVCSTAQTDELSLAFQTRSSQGFDMRGHRDYVQRTDVFTGYY
jgi:hypothetical protein